MQNHNNYCDQLFKLKLEVTILYPWKYLESIVTIISYKKTDRHSKTSKQTDGLLYTYTLNRGKFLWGLYFMVQDFCYFVVFNTVVPVSAHIRICRHFFGEILIFVLTFIIIKTTKYKGHKNFPLNSTVHTYKLEHEQQV